MSEPKRAQTFCGRCNHPMHWHECGGWDTPCRCRNDESTTPPVPAMIPKTDAGKPEPLLDGPFYGAGGGPSPTELDSWPQTNDTYPEPDGRQSSEYHRGWNAAMAAREQAVTPKPEPLSAEEEAEYRRVHVGSAGPHSSTTCYRCWEGTCPVPVLLATLDAARAQAATEARRELLATIAEGPLAEALHDAMCDISHHDRPPARCSKWARYPNIAASVAPRLRRLIDPSHV